jgi:pimeloyl-ACP methyl ester carboxylesterase
MRIKSFLKKSKLVDKHSPIPPFYLSSEDLIAKEDGREVFLKRIFSTAPGIISQGPVILAPGVATNANIFRITENGECLFLDDKKSFANLLASHGFDVYLYHPGFTERVHNRYVCRYCSDSMHYKKKYKVPKNFSFKEIVQKEIPLAIKFVCTYSESDKLSWVGYSLGGMMMYSYLSQFSSPSIKNVITIASPMTLNQIFIRFVPFLNFVSSSLGMEETTILGTVFENLVPLTRLIRGLPDWVVRFNLVSPLLFNPLNIRNKTIKTILGKIIEPIPDELERFFSQIIRHGFSAQDKFSSYLNSLRKLRKTNKNFLFIYGSNDMIATPESIFLAREIISPTASSNLIGVPNAGHIDVLVGKNSMRTVWEPCLQWLKDKSEA